MAGPTHVQTRDAEEFVFSIHRPSVAYHLHLRVDIRREDLSREHQAVEFLAECLWPDRFKGRMAHAELIATPRDDPNTIAKARSGLGALVVTPQRFTLYGYVSPEVCHWLSLAMATGLVTSMNAGGPWRSPSHMRLTALSFHGAAFDPAACIGA